MLDEKTFLGVIDSAPLVSIDLIIEDHDGRVLLGKRVNRPARGYWFVPGGRVMKNEKLAEAIKRISAIELGISIDMPDAHLLGAFDHIYEDNCFAVEGINTQYVVLAYKLNIGDNTEVRPDYQHSEIRWWPKSELLTSPDVHHNTKAYFAGT